MIATQRTRQYLLPNPQVPSHGTARTYIEAFNLEPRHSGLVDITDFEEFLSFGDDTTPLMMLVWILPIIFFVFYGQQIQLYISANQIKKHIGRLREYRDGAKSELVAHIKGGAEVSPDAARRIGMIVDYFSIMPVDMDPAGIVPKVRHMVRSREEHTRAQIRSIDPGMSELEQAKAQTLVEVASSLHLVYRIVNHLYLTAKKQKNFPMILPLQMMLPFLMEEAKALKDSVPAFRAGQPVGDGIGPMVVGRMMLDLEKREAAFRTVWSSTEIDRRRVHLLKARGPMSTVGRMGDAVEHVLDGAEVGAIIMIDAALRLEGEESASVSRGFGAAIGGIGTERFQIEDIATRNKIPVYAIVVKQTVGEAITLMTREIAMRADEVACQVREMIRETVPEGGSVLVIGVGNTVGVSQ